MGNNKKKSVVLIGAGAIGTTLASRLCGSNIDFKIAADKQRVLRYIKNGIYFCGKKIKTRCFTPDYRNKKADLILIAVKNYSLSNTLNTIAPIVGNKTVIIPLLNGITSEIETANKFSEKNVLYGYYIGHTATRVDNNTSQDGNYTIVIGDYPSSNDEFSDKTIEAYNIMRQAGINVEIHKNMKREIWKKFAVNICLNQVTAYYNCTYGEVKDDKLKLRLFDNLAKEVALIAQLENIYNEKELYSYIYKILGVMNPEDRSSMAQDVLNNRFCEYESFSGTLIKIADLHHVELPFNTQVFQYFKSFYLNQSIDVCKPASQTSSPTANLKSL